MTFLSINAGSSSLKVAVFDHDNPEIPKTSVSIEGIGTSESCLIPEGKFGSEDTKWVPIESHYAAADIIKQWFSEDLSISPEDIKAIGYRAVHGGDEFKEATLVNEDVLNHLEAITPLAPNHMPATLASIRAFTSSYPETKHVVCFDTAFFRDIPRVAQILPIKKEIAEKYNLKRYGFHGLSYQSLLDDFEKNEGQETASGRIIMAHLGSGASVCAVVNGKPIDMSMGFTPVSGIMMSTRTGDIEPGVITFLQEKGLSSEEIAQLVTHESGLLGVSGTTADMYTLLQTQSTNPDAALAIELFTYKIKKQIGAYMAALGGVDSIIFSGGIGERSAEIRRRILSGLEFVGIELNEERNEESQRQISSDSSKVGVHTIQAREDVSIIKQIIEVME